MGRLGDIYRLMRAGLVFAQYGVRLVPKGAPVPVFLRLAGILVLPWRLVTWPWRANIPQSERLVMALVGLGPSYIKLGQFFAARPDLVGREIADELSALRDRLPPFSQAEARRAIRESLGAEPDALYSRFEPPIAAASIAQVHKARTDSEANSAAEASSTAPTERVVAVKILRPNVERRFQNDLSSFYFVARQIERFHPPSRRLKPVAVVDTLARSTTLEMDLRLEAAAIAEFAEATKDDPGFRVPAVDWQRTSKRVLTTEWIDGIPIGDIEALRAAGHDTDALGYRVIREFLRHAMRDGTFHADMHQGNLFVDSAGDIVAVDFGIIGRLGPRERRFLAEILYGFITRDYRRAAEVHFWAGYVPDFHPVETFAQALRAIGEPIMDQPAEKISMGHLLGQLFAYTEVFDMQTRPELILLQKTMVVVEGVARELNPTLNMWTAGEPVVREWMAHELGAAGRLRDMREGAATFARVLGDLPSLLAEAETTARAFSNIASSGLRLDDATVEAIAAAEARRSRSGRLALWVIAFALVAIALQMVP